MIRNAVDPELFALPRDPDPPPGFSDGSRSQPHTERINWQQRVMNQDQIECRWAEGRLGNIAHRHIQVTSHRSFTETLQGYRIMPPGAIRRILVMMNQTRSRRGKCAMFAQAALVPSWAAHSCSSRQTSSRCSSASWSARCHISSRTAQTRVGPLRSP